MTPTIQDLIDRDALFVINHSGGKDSQAMMIKIRERVPAAQIIVIHATLGDIEWPGTIEHITDTIGDLPFIVAEGTKTFMEMVDHRGMWPSPKNRQCTSDLKRDPINREIRRHIKATGHHGLIVNCMGLRAQESSSRAKATTFQASARNSKAGREWYDWLPIHDMLIEEVFATIEAAGEKPHWAYAEGMSRLSCCFCIMASRADLTRAAELRPALYAEYCDKEMAIDQTFTMPAKGVRRFLPEVTGIDPIKAGAQLTLAI